MSESFDKRITMGYCPDNRLPRCKSNNGGLCSCLTNTTFSATRRNEYGEVRCPFYSAPLTAATMPCRRTSCVYQMKGNKGACSSTAMYQDCPWQRNYDRRAAV